MLKSGSVIQGSFVNGSPRTVQLAPRFALASHGPGQPLPPAVRQKMESFFRTSFTDVRVHVAPSVPAMGAMAFTNGSNIHFAPGHYDPISIRGQQALGRELAHVVQQRAGRVRNPFGNGVAVVHDQLLESEARRLGEQAAVHVPGLAGGAAVQRIEPLTFGLGMAAMAAVGAVAWGLSYCFGGRQQVQQPQDPVAPYKNMVGLQRLRATTRSGGDSQGTTALLEAADGTHYLVEQDNCHNCQQVMSQINVTYINAGARQKGSHAEMRMVAYFKHNNKVIGGSKIWVNKDICKSCAAELQKENVTMLVPIETDDPYDDWLHWKVLLKLGYNPAEAAYTGPKRSGWGEKQKEQDAVNLQRQYGNIENLDRSTRTTRNRNVNYKG